MIPCFTNVIVGKHSHVMSKICRLYFEICTTKKQSRAVERNMILLLNQVNFIHTPYLKKRLFNGFIEKTKTNTLKLCALYIYKSRSHFYFSAWQGAQCTGSASRGQRSASWRPLQATTVSWRWTVTDVCGCGRQPLVICNAPLGSGGDW